MLTLFTLDFAFKRALELVPSSAMLEYAFVRSACLVSPLRPIISFALRNPACMCIDAIGDRKLIQLRIICALSLLLELSVWGTSYWRLAQSIIA